MIPAVAAVSHQDGCTLVDWKLFANGVGKLKPEMMTFDGGLLDELLMTVPTRYRQDNYMDRLA